MENLTQPLNQIEQNVKMLRGTPNKDTVTEFIRNAAEVARTAGIPKEQAVRAFGEATVWNEAGAGTSKR